MPTVAAPWMTAYRRELVLTLSARSGLTLTSIIGRSRGRSILRIQPVDATHY
jgi:hypothetical protein